MSFIKRKAHSTLIARRPSANCASSELKDGAVVLLYHRIAESRLDPQLLCVTPAHFAQHLELIKKYYCPISLQDLKNSIVIGHIPRNSIAVTFDDGYADNLWKALPLLERHGIPATVFVSSGLVGHSLETTSDTLERILLTSASLPEVLTIKIAGKSYQWFFDDSPAQLQRWDVTSKFDPSPRHVCYRQLHRMLRPMSSDQREKILAELILWAGCDPMGRRQHLVMSAEELVEIRGSGLIEVGSHGVNHLMLSQQSPDVQEFELSFSKRELEKILKQPVTSFAYPYGGKEAVNPKTIELVPQHGYDLACDNVPGTVSVNSNIYAIPRHLVRDWDGEEFAKRLKNAFLDRN